MVHRMNQSPQGQQALLQLFLGHLKAGRKHQANQVLAQVLKADPAQAASYALLIGSLLAQKGQYEEAVPLYQEAKRLNPSEPAAYFYLGVALHALKKEMESHQVWDELAKRFPGHAFDHYQCGLRLTTSNQLAEARKTFEQALELLEPHDPVREDLRSTIRAIEQKLNTK